MTYTHALDALLSLIVQGMLYQAAQAIDHIKSLHWCLPRWFSEGLDTLELWLAEAFQG